MEIPTVSPAEIAQALELCYGFPAEKAFALATAGIEQVRSPWTVPGMEPLVERVLLALKREEPLLVFGDFDADGVTGTAVLFQALRAYSSQVHRHNPLYQAGYGLHPDQVDRFAQEGIRVILTVDAGISSHLAIDHARGLGVEVLVTDHHLLREDYGPPNALWIDPPDHVLSGAQVAYLVAWAVRQRMEGTADHDPAGLAISAVGAQMDWVVADLPETRAWVATAQRIINSPDCPPGLLAIKNWVGEAYAPSEMRAIGGMLNMAKRSRLVNPGMTVEALLPDTSHDRRLEILGFLTDERSRVHRAGEVITSQALDRVRREAGPGGLLIFHVEVPDETLSEVESSLTSRIVEVTGRPALVLRPTEQQINFSGRSRGSFSFETFLSDPKLRSLVIDMGGHRQAIGGSVRRKDEAAFEEAVRRWAENVPPAPPVPAEETRPTIPLPLLYPATAYLYGRAMGPFGHHLRAPHFRTTLRIRGGWAFSGDSLVELLRPIGEGEWDVVFRFDEAGCDGQNIAVRVDEAQRP